MSDITESVSLFNQSVGNLGASIHNYGAEKLGLSEEEKKKQYNRLIAEQVKESPLGGTSVGKVASLGIEGGQMTPAQIASFLGQSAEESIGWLARESIGNEGARSLLNETLAKYNFVKYNQAKYQEAGALDAKIERGIPAGEKPKEYKYSVSGNGLVTSLKNLKSIKVPLKTPEGKEIGVIDIDTESDEPLSNQIASKISSGVGGFLGFGKTKFDPQQQDAIYKLASDAVRGQISNYLQSVAGDVYLSNPTKLAFHTERILGQWMAGGFKQWQKYLSDPEKGYINPIEDTVYDSVSSPQTSNKIIRAGGPDAGIYDINAPAEQAVPLGAVTPEEFKSMVDEIKAGLSEEKQALIDKISNPNNIKALYDKFKAEKSKMKKKPFSGTSGKF